MTNERDRLEDLNIEEAAGRTAPPDLTARILNAAEHGTLEEAPTPISGAHAVPRNVRPAGRRHTAAVPRRNWQGAGIVTAFMLLLTVGLVAFVIWKAPVEETNQPRTAGQPAANQDPSRQPAGASAEEGERWSPPSNAEQKPEPQPQPEQSDPKNPDPQPDDSVEQPKPEPKPDDTVEQPKPEPKPDDTVEQPKPEPKPDDGTSAEPAQAPVVVASFSAEGRGVHTFGNARKVRTKSTDRWCEADSDQAPGIKLEEERNVYWVHEGTQLKFLNEAVSLANGAQALVNGELSISTHAQGLHLELLDNDIYIDNQRTTSTVRVARGEFEVVIVDGAALIESSNSRLEIFCTDGEISANGTIIPAGYMTSLTSRGLSTMKLATRNDWVHSWFRLAPVRHLGIEEFEIAPLGKMISGRLEARTAAQLDAKADGYVAVDTGSSAAVAFGFDGEHETLRGEMVRVRYRSTGAEKMVLQMFCPARNDNFGIDLTPGKAGEWHVLEIKLSDLRNRETHTDAPAAGTVLSSFTLSIEGKNNAQLEVDWVELVREAKFEE